MDDLYCFESRYGDCRSSVGVDKRGGYERRRGQWRQKMKEGSYGVGYDPWKWRERTVTTRHAQLVTSINNLFCVVYVIFSQDRD